MRGVGERLRSAVSVGRRNLSGMVGFVHGALQQERSMHTYRRSQRPTLACHTTDLMSGDRLKEPCCSGSLAQVERFGSSRCSDQKEGRVVVKEGEQYTSSQPLRYVSHSRRRRPARACYLFESLRLDADKMLRHWEGNGHGQVPTTAEGLQWSRIGQTSGPRGMNGTNSLFHHT